MKLKKFVSDNGGVTRDFHQIDPRLLQVRPDFNIRDLTTAAAREKLDILKAQVKAEGVLEPLEIEFDGETPWINEGHRRHIVVMELIAEGHAFKTIPCVQERLNIKADKRTLHMLMRSKEDYEPLEYAKGIDRMVNVYGWDRKDLAEHLGFKSKASIDGYLDMLAMPEPVKEHVRQGHVSATLAKQISKSVDPERAAQVIKENLEENKRIKGTKNRKTKVTRKTLERDKPKPTPVSDPPKPETEKVGTTPQTVLVDELHEQSTSAQTFSPLSDETPPVVRQEMFADEIDTAATMRERDEAPHEPHEQLQAAAARDFPASAFRAPTAAMDYDRELFAIVSRLATFAEGFDLNSADNGETLSCEFPIKLLQDADRAYRARISDTAEAA